MSETAVWCNLARLGHVDGINLTDEDDPPFVSFAPCLRSVAVR